MSKPLHFLYASFIIPDHSLSSVSPGLARSHQAVPKGR